MCILSLVGNYGVPGDSVVNNLSAFYESEKIHVRGLVISDYSFRTATGMLKRALMNGLKRIKFLLSMVLIPVN